jgi:hypothetical protein
VNRSLSQFQGLEAQPVDLLTADGLLDLDAVDELIEQIVTTDADVVVDSGAASFVPLSDYLSRNMVPSAITDTGRDVFFHSLLVGGGHQVDTGKGFNAAAETFGEHVKLVVWINEMLGKVEFDGTPFEETSVYQKHKKMVAGLVHLTERDMRAYGHTVSKVFGSHQTFAEALADPAFMLVPKQRVTQYRRAVWEQLSKII